MCCRIQEGDLGTNLKEVQKRDSSQVAKDKRAQEPVLISVTQTGRAGEERISFGLNLL